MSARALLDIAAEYVEARQSVTLADGMGATPVHDLDEIAGRFERELGAYVAQA